MLTEIIYVLVQNHKGYAVCHFERVRLMGLNSILTIENVLAHEVFKDAEVIAGKLGLFRSVSWIHIFEMTDIESFVNGNEMILSTGVHFAQNIESFLSYLQKLINLQVSCLCLELGQSVKSIPLEVIELANRNDFPIILFKKTVRFVDITQAIHALIINDHCEILEKLNNTSRAFFRSTLESKGIRNILELLQASTKAQVIYLPMHNTSIFFPASSLEKQAELLQLIQQPIENFYKADNMYYLKLGEQYILIQDIGAMGQTWARLCIVKNQDFYHYDRLLLDSATISIAQDLLKKKYIRESELHTENLWVNELIHNRLKDEILIQAQIGHDEYKTLNNSDFQVCVLEVKRIKHEHEDALESANKSMGIHLSLIVRSAFEQHAFRTFNTFKNNRLVILIFHPSSGKKQKDPFFIKEKLQLILKNIDKMMNGDECTKFQLFLGIGTAYKGFHNTSLSYEEATKALFLKTFYQSPTIFYEDLGAFQILLNLHEKGMLESYVNSHLGLLIEEDCKKNSDLLKTLKVYLESNGSKKSIADELHIVRQSLYYRLEKIKELLGEDYMSTQKRLALQLAIQAYELLNHQAS